MDGLSPTYEKRPTRGHDEKEQRNAKSRFCLLMRPHLSLRRSGNRDRNRSGTIYPHPRRPWQSEDPRSVLLAIAVVVLTLSGPVYEANIGHDSPPIPAETECRAKRLAAPRRDTPRLARSTAEPVNIVI